VIVVLAAVWVLAVSPERQQASKLAAQLSAAKSEAASAQAQAASARAAESQYDSAYASIVSLGKAVPSSQEVPSLIYQLAQATNQKNVEFASIATGSGASSSAPASASAASAAASSGVSQMPFTFVFNGTFSGLDQLFERLNRFIVRTPSGGLQVSGRLLTVQSLKLAPTAGSGGGQGAGSGQLSGTITATAYVLPAVQPGSSTAAGSAPASATPVSGGASSPTAPAIVRVNP
jgi:hypothetical protein